MSVPAGPPSPRERFRDRDRVARLGEYLAARFLVRRGARLIGRNVRVGRGEIDLHVWIGNVPVAVEVKTIVTRCEGDDAVRRLGARKADVVRRYAARLDPPAHRVDFVAVTLRPEGAEVRWAPFAC